MRYNKSQVLKNGREVVLRNGTEEDGEAVYENFKQTHAETDYLLSYPDETGLDSQKEGEFLRQKTESPNEIEILAIVDGKIAGTAGIDAIGSKYKVKHRAEFGISVLKEYWGMGIGTLLTKACVECSKTAGYEQLELDVVSGNTRAVAMYQKAGFREYGRNPRGFKSRTQGYQEIIHMRLEL